MFFLLNLNNLLFTIFFTRNITNTVYKYLCFTFTFFILSSTVYYFSPIIVLVLYGKYLWVTFIMLFFLSKNNYLKVLFLLLSAFSDEFGLISTLFIFALKYSDYLYNINIFQQRKIHKILIITLLSSFILLLAFFGLSAILFNIGSGIASLLITFGGESIRYAIIDKFDAVLQTFINLILGASFISEDYIKLFILLKIIIALIITYFIFLNFVEFKKNIKIIFKNKYIQKNIFIIFSITMFVIINLTLLPGGGNDLGHRGYPRFITIMFIFFYIIYNKIRSVYILPVLSLILVLHIYFLFFSKQTINKFSYKLENFLFIDTTVSKKDLDNINNAVKEFKESNYSQIFDKINDKKDIDLSGTWYYSRIKNYDTTKNSYFPIRGTIKVMIWPKNIH